LTGQAGIEKNVAGVERPSRRRHHKNYNFPRPLCSSLTAGIGAVIYRELSIVMINYFNKKAAPPE